MKGYIKHMIYKSSSPFLVRREAYSIAVSVVRLLRSGDIDKYLADVIARNLEKNSFYGYARLIRLNFSQSFMDKKKRRD